MKKMLSFLMLLLVCLLVCAAAEDDMSWTNAPVITKAYEISSGKLYIEWEGSAPVYQVYMDGANVTSVIVTNAVIDIQKGTHSIAVYPINEQKSAETKVDFGLQGSVLKGAELGGNISIDLGALGLDPKKLVAGESSELLYIDYMPNPIFSGQPEIAAATTNFNNQVSLSFADRYNADEYLISIKTGNDVSYVKFNKNDEDAAKLMVQDNATMTITLAPDFLQKQGCWSPELNTKYRFTVQLRKYADNLLNGENVVTVIHESKESKELSYTPEAAWKTGPVITYASQTADGQVTLEWTHEDNGMGCEYAVMRVKKLLGISTGEEELLVTGQNSAVLNDLMNDDYAFIVKAKLNGEVGKASAEASVPLRNDWVVAPVLVCQQNGNKVKLSWTAAEGVETYYIIVYKGDNESLLRFVNLDFSEFARYELPAVEGEMQHSFEYDKAIDPVNGEKLKFEIYGVRHAANGEEQRTTVTSQIVIIRETISE